MDGTRCGSTSEPGGASTTECSSPPSVNSAKTQMKRQTRDRYQPRSGMVLGVLLVSAVLAAQEQQPLRSRVVLVPVDVRIVDAKGNAVSDLTKADFEIRENG